MTPWHDLRYSLMDSFIPAMSVLLTLGSTSGSLYFSLSLFYSASRHTVSSHTPATSQAKVHLNQWWNRKTAWGFLGLWLKLLPSIILAIWFQHNFADVINIIVNEDSKASFNCLVLALWQAIWLFQDWIWAVSTYPRAMRPQFQALAPDVPAWFFPWHRSSLSSDAMSRIEVAPFLHIFHQHFPLHRLLQP